MTIRNKKRPHSALENGRHFLVVRENCYEGGLAIIPKLKRKAKRPPYTGGLFANTINKERRDCDSNRRYAE
jgi:hypothetical protein